MKGLCATYTFEKTFDVGVDTLEALGVLWELLLDLFGSNEQGFQIRPRSLNFLKDGENITGKKTGKRISAGWRGAFKLPCMLEQIQDYTALCRT